MRTTQPAPRPGRGEPESIGGLLLTFAVVAGSACCFCSKGVFAKAAFARDAEPLTLLALRMGMAFPFFALGAWMTSRPRRASGNGAAAAPPNLSARDWASLAGLGFLGYYLSSLVNFTGLQFVSVGLERVILYTYPSLVLVASAVRRRRAPGLAVTGATLAAWAGVATAFSGEMAVGAGGSASPDLAAGCLLVLASAVTYAAFVTLGAPLARRLGGIRFTSITVGFSCLVTLAHFGIVTAVRGSFAVPSVEVMALGAILAGVGTVVPAFLMGIGLKRAGARRFAVISSIGPVVSLILAAAVLGERVGAVQACGFALCLAGGLGVALLRHADE